MTCRGLVCLCLMSDVWGSCLRAWRWAERGRHGHTSAYELISLGSLKKFGLNWGFGSW